MRGERRCGGGGGGSASTNGGPRSAELLFQPLCTHRVFGVYGVARDGDTHGRARRTTPHRLAHRTVSRIAPFARYARTEAPSIAARARAHRPHSRPSRVDACLARRRRRRRLERDPRALSRAIASPCAYSPHHPSSSSPSTTTSARAHRLSPKKRITHTRELVHRRRRRRRSRQRRSRRRRSPRHRARSTARASRSRAAADAAAEPTTRAPTLSTSGEPHARRRRRRSSRHRRGGVVERARAMRA